MPPFPERESSILAKLKKKKPSSVPDAPEEKKEHKLPQAQMSNNIEVHAPPVQLNSAAVCIPSHLGNLLVLF